MKVFEFDCKVIELISLCCLTVLIIYVLKLYRSFITFTYRISDDNDDTE